MKRGLEAELLKDLANHIARELHRGEGGALATLMGLLGSPSSGADASASAAAREGAHRVGIWEQQGAEGIFTRRQQDRAEWHAWANIGRIEPKANRFRVLLLGESAARGFFFDPHFTPAMVLEKLLQGRLGARPLEVIDLTRTDLGTEIGALAVSALELQPDAVVCFAGNNWGPRLSADRRVTQCVSTALKGGVAALGAWAQQRLDVEANRVVATVRDAYSRRGVPVVWMVPECNLADWQEPLRGAPYLSEGANEAWNEALAEARAALRRGEEAAAAAAARRMAQLDGGISATPLLILGLCARRAGDLPASREFLQSARDAELWDWQRIPLPRALGPTQAALRHAGTDALNRSTDLPRVFAAHLSNQLPGRTLFMDYCHLTSEGIRVAMSAAAADLLSLLGSSSASWQELYARAPTPRAEVTADAHFLAAIHNAHWHQPYETVLHHCQQALRASAKVARTMSLFAELQSTRVPALLSRAGAAITAECSASVQRYILRYSTQRYDEVLIRAIADALEKAGAANETDLCTLRTRGHSASRQPVDLLDFYFTSSVQEPAELAWMMRRGAEDTGLIRSGYYIACASESRFLFPADGEQALTVRLTWRAPGVTDERRAVILLNADVLAERTITPHWRDLEIRIPRERLKPGANILSVRWPALQIDARQQLQHVAADLLRGVVRPMFPVFGEIQAATVSRVACPS